MGDFTEEQKTFMNKLFQQLNTTINETATEIRTEFKKQIDFLNIEVCSIKNKFEERITKTETENKELQNKIINLERKQRKNNIVIFGIDNTEADKIESVTNLLKDYLQIEIERKDIIEVHRLNNRNNSRNNPVIVTFMSYEKKLLVLKNSKHLKGKGVYISSDQCWEDRQQTKKLITYQKQFRERGETAYIKDGKLIVSNKVFTLEQLENQEVSAKTKSREEERREFIAGQKRLLQDGDPRERDSDQKKTRVNPTEIQGKGAVTKITTRSQIKN